MKSESPSFIFVCFSTDNEAYKPMSIIRQYLIFEECKNVKYKEDSVEFNHNLNKDNNYVHFKFYEILDIDKSNSKCNFADSYLILINLEKVDIFGQMDSIFNYIQNNGNSDKKMYIIGLYMNANNIKDEYKEENIKEYLEQQNTNYEYSEVNFDSTNELIKIIDFISNDTIKTKKNYIKQNNNNNEHDNDQSGSKCFIF